MVLLDKISEEYILSPNSFQDINKVELKIVALNEQYALAKDKETKKFTISEKYQIQRKQLELKQEVKVVKSTTPKETQQKEKGIKPTTFVINDKDEIVEQIPQVERLTTTKDSVNVNTENKDNSIQGAVKVQNRDMMLFAVSPNFLNARCRS